ncbi:hypothetical protein CDQ84_09535 [Clostridium thermosuccinogenes]|uniref:ABC transporter domain-containing protein n=1 Tax=Clostridium thermosuccinogenes TaxID=84032 RepID=A0A2K2FJY8_9CLOT|nr:ABC transporter ATP-binding protein [Pseudoclostridium thermosuccinogenes]AUS98247.1 hypothetical protein CDO33_18360 [Pseudoclostridium thermosuccinogenes]PNT97195.1 hypothetical protein CDQ85_09385 [Pseudoclostridium thermosuccinogenes]PNT99087.1 hypothetical protein CDQ84_09535 [Pseudoclostridium thermosuccinogenes]
MKAVECSALTKKFAKTTALDSLTFSLDENKIIGLIGRNGAGKTTFLKTCAGYIKPTSGEIKVFGEKVFDNMNAISKLIYIYDDIKYNDSLRLGDILKLGPLYYKDWNSDFAVKLLKRFGLKDHMKYCKLSRGMKTQFNIIVGLCSRAPLSLLDEPTLGLDAAVRKDFYNILLNDYMEHPRTIIISSHLLSELENLLEEIVLIDNGKLVLHKSVEELQEYGVYLNGRSDIIGPFIKDKQVLSLRKLGNSIIAGIKNDLSDADRSYLSANNVDISKINVEDVCIYLTRKREDGEPYAF